MIEGLCALYARVSSESQARDNTIASQVMALRERIAADGFSLEPDQSYVDEGYSGSILARPALERLRDAVAGGHIERIYVHAPDRLARRYAHQVLVIDEFRRAGAEVVFLNRPIGGTAEDDLLLQVQGVIAEYERAKILERGRRGRLHAARSGSVSALTGAPFGYRYVSRTQGGGEARFEVVEDEAHIVRLIFAWVSLDRLSMREVCRRLHQMGCQTRRGSTDWYASTALEQAQANKLKDEAQLANARLDLDRLTRLVTTNAVSKQQADTARALVAQLDASVKAGQALIDMARTNLDYTKVHSPIDGRAGTRMIDIGNMIRATDAAGIVTINQMNPIFVNFALPADSLPPVRAKLKDGKVPVTVQDSNLVDLATGELTVIDNQVNAATGTVTYKATFANDDQVLWPGQFVNVRIELDIRRDVLALPVRAVQQGPTGPFVFVVGQGRKVERRPIKTGLMSKTTAIVESGLQPGETVVTDGQYRIQQGTLVEVLTNVAETP
jgi:RND family efflux transporter MFP subunit